MIIEVAVFADRHFVSDFFKNTGQFSKPMTVYQCRLSTNTDGYTHAGASRKSRDTKNVDLRIPRLCTSVPE